MSIPSTVLALSGWGYRLSAQGHISEDELSEYLADLKNQIGNLRLLLESVEADLSQYAEKREIAQTTSAWLATLQERISEVETETEEAFQARRQLVKLLVAGVTIGRREDGEREVRITYRFGPPTEPNAEFIAEGMFVSSMANVLELRYGEVQHSPAPISRTLSTARRDGIGGACDDHQGDDQHDGRHDQHDHDHDGHHERGVNKDKQG
jgi:hypothetical protein